MIDRLILIRLLEILDQLDGIALAEYVLVDELALKSSRPLTTEEARANIRHASDEGWIRKSVGLTREVRWARTPAGKAALQELRSTP